MTEVGERKRPSDEMITNAYVYLLSRFLVIRQEHADAAADGFAYNSIAYNPLGSADFVNPNFDVAYLEAWFAVDEEHPVLLRVPRIEGRYHTAQILDEWGEVIVNINDRATPATPHGTFALMAPGSTAAVPDGAVPLSLHSAKAKMLARIEIGDDPEGAVALQHQFTATPLGRPSVRRPVPIPSFDNHTLLGVEIFDDLDTVLGSAQDVSPAAASMQLSARAVAAHLAHDPAARDDIDSFLHRTVVPRFQHYALTQSAPYVLVDHRRLGARLPRHPQRPAPLQLQRPLRPHLRRRRIPHPRPRPHAPAAIAETNWLPTAPGRAFSLTFRAYLPKPFVPDGGWAPPPVTPMT